MSRADALGEREGRLSFEGRGEERKGKETAHKQCLLFSAHTLTYLPPLPANATSKQQTNSGGIPIAFPQWRDGLLPHDGFAGRLEWEVVGADLAFDFSNLVGRRDMFRNGEAELLIDDDGESLVGGAGVGPQGEPEWAEAAVAAAAAAEQQAAAAGRGRRGRKKATEEGGGGGGSDEDAGGGDAALPPAPSPDGGEAGKRKRGRPRKTSDVESSGGAGSDLDDGGGGGDFMDDYGGGRYIAAGALEAVPEAAGSSGDDDDDEGASGGSGGDDDDGLPPDVAAVLAGIQEGDVDWAVVGDVAPYVELRLRDTEETRAMWPHAFELTCRVRGAGAAVLCVSCALALRACAKCSALAFAHSLTLRILPLSFQPLL